MKAVFKGGMIGRTSGGIRFERADLAVDGTVVSSSLPADPSVFDCSDLLILPGFVDVHVHFREPGFSYKETVRSGCAAAARGGYTAVCTMPNLSPAPDGAENLRAVLAPIERDGTICVLPYGTITRGQAGEVLSEMDAMAPYVAAFSDDGRGVQSEEMMEAAMRRAKALGKIIAAHCEDNALLHGGYIHEGAYAKAHGHRGISSESEWRQLARDLDLVRKTGCAYHACHMSTKESVALLRRAKAEGLNVTAETAPHYLVLDDTNLREDGRFKMNPPLRAPEDREALIEAVLDGTIDMIATDHAPHSAEEKSRGLEKSAMGITGLECAFPVMYTALVRPGILTLERLAELMCVAPRRRFGIGGGTEAGESADFTVIDLCTPFRIDSADFASMGKATPFDGMEVYGKIKHTCYKGETVWQER